MLFIFFHSIFSLIMEHQLLIHFTVKSLGSVYLLYKIFTLEKFYVKIFLGYFIIFNVLLYFRLLFSDAGRIRKNLFSYFNLNTLFLLNDIKISINLETQTRELYHCDKFYRQKFCITCNIFRPPGTSHCSECDFCILDKDHHCYILNTCIGRNNIKEYYFFITAEIFFFLLLFYFSRLKILFILIIFNFYILIKYFYFALLNINCRDYYLRQEYKEIKEYDKLNIVKKGFNFKNIIKRLLTFKSQIINDNL